MKIKNDIKQIFIQSLKLYGSNFKNLTGYMAFPVLGQVFGIVLTLWITYIYAQNLPMLIEKYAFFDNFMTIVLVTIGLALPGLIIFMKAFWEFLVAYGAINSMTENAIKSGKVYDFSAHTELIKRRSGAFIGLWLLYGLFAIIGINPLFWVVAGILFVYFVLVFQVFTFEPEMSAIGCFKKSFLLIKHNFARTVGLMALVGGLTYILIPWLFDFALRVPSDFLAAQIEGWCAQFPIPSIAPLYVARFIISSIVSFVVIGFTLPLRSICWSLWYIAITKQKN